MMLSLHIVIALASLVVVTLAYARPTIARLRLAYGLVGATLVTGTALVALSPSHLASACTSGLLYFSIVMIGIVMARHKLARIEL